MSVENKKFFGMEARIKESDLLATLGAMLAVAVIVIAGSTFESKKNVIKQSSTPTPMSGPTLP